jgi:hypothetical protein
MRQPMPRSAPLAVGVLWIGIESVARVSAATPGTLSRRRDAAPGCRCAHPGYNRSLDNIPTRIIVRIVLSVRGASRGVVERDRSSAGRPAGEGLAQLHGAAAPSLTRRPARCGSHPQRPGGKRSAQTSLRSLRKANCYAAATMSGCPSRGWTGRNEAGEIPVLPAPGRTVPMPIDRRWWARRDGDARWIASHRDQPPTLRRAARPRPSSR